MALMSTLGISAGRGVGGTGGTKTVVAGEAKDGLEETTGEVWCQYFRRE